MELIKTFKVFSSFAGLKPNFSKCEIAGIGVLKGVKMAVCGMKAVDLTTDTVKILGVHFSYNKQIQNEKNFLKSITDIQNVLKAWSMRKLTLDGKITIFKALAFSKIVYLALLTTVPDFIIKEIERIQKKFLWNNSTPKIKHNILRMDFKHGGLKSVDISLKITSLQCSWLTRLYDTSYHEWKIIPTYFIGKIFGKNFKFHSNFDFQSSLVQCFPSYYRSILEKWKQYFHMMPTVSSCILNQFLWYNKFLKIDNSVVFFKEFSNKGINFLVQLFDKENKIKSWSVLKEEYNLENKNYFQFLQLIHCIPEIWKTCISQSPFNTSDLTISDHHITTSSRVLAFAKLNSKEIYFWLIKNFEHRPTSQIYFETNFPTIQLSWNDIYLMPRKTTVSSYMRCFQYKILNNVLYLNKKLYIFKKTNSPLCSFCKSKDETVFHLFSECTYTLRLWSKLSSFFRNEFSLPILTPQTAIFGFIDTERSCNYYLFNHILLIFKLYIYQARDINTLCFEMLIEEITKVKKIEKQIAMHSQKKTARYNKKWCSTNPKLRI